MPHVILPLAGICPLNDAPTPQWTVVPETSAHPLVAYTFHKRTKLMFEEHMDLMMGPKRLSVMTPGDTQYHQAWAPPYA